MLGHCIIGLNQQEPRFNPDAMISSMPAVTNAERQLDVTELIEATNTLACSANVLEHRLRLGATCGFHSRKIRETDNPHAVALADCLAARIGCFKGRRHRVA
jgi:hypothetical protein